MRSRDFRLVMLGAAAILAAALPASACPEWKIAPVDSAWAPRVWIEARSPVTYGAEESRYEGSSTNTTS